MPNKDKDPATEGAMPDLSSPREACQTKRDIRWEREARDTALVKQVSKAVAREMAKAHVQYTAMFSEMHTPAIPTTLNVTSSVNGFKAMDPFDWTKERDI